MTLPKTIADEIEKGSRDGIQDIQDESIREVIRGLWVDGAEFGYSLAHDEARLSKEKLAIAMQVFKMAEGYMFMACQPSQGKLFGEFDDNMKKILKQIAALDTPKTGEGK